MSRQAWQAVGYQRWWMEEIPPGHELTRRPRLLPGELPQSRSAAAATAAACSQGMPPCSPQARDVHPRTQASAETADAY